MSKRDQSRRVMSVRCGYAVGGGGISHGQKRQNPGENAPELTEPDHDND